MYFYNSTYINLIIFGTKIKNFITHSSSIFQGYTLPSCDCLEDAFLKTAEQCCWLDLLSCMVRVFLSTNIYELCSQKVTVQKIIKIIYIQMNSDIYT